MALSEALAARSLGVVEPWFHALQTAVLLAAGAGLMLAPPRWAGACPLIAVGLLHQATVLSGRVSGVVLVGLGVVHAAAVLAVWSRVERARTWVFLAAYATQALACAQVLFPLERAARQTWLAPVAFLAVTGLPLAALVLARRVAAPGVRRRPATLLALVAIPAATLAFGGSLSRAAHRRLPGPRTKVTAPAADVILIVLDTVRADRTSVYGHDRPTTPNLEDLARTATVYARAQTAGTWTLPGHASMFTGLQVSEHGADHRPDGRTDRLSPRALTLAEELRDAGWRTACVAANADMFVEGFGLTQGFEYKWAEAGVTRHLAVPWIAGTLTHALFGQHARTRLGPLERDSFAPAREIDRVALDWLDRTEATRPRLLFLNYMEAHGQLRREPCGAPAFGAERSFLETDVPNYAAVMAGREDPDPDAVRKVRDWYDSELACLDHHLGELFAALRARGLFDESLIVVTADHGQMLGENRSFHHRSEVWEGLVHVPLIVKAPGQTEAARCEVPQPTLDLFAAIPQLAAGTTALAPCPLPGRSGPPVTETRRQARMVELAPDRWNEDWTTLRSGTTKFAINSDGALWVLEPRADGELPRAPTAAERAEFERLRDAWSASLVPPLRPAPAAEDDQAGQRREALRRLGYVE